MIHEKQETELLRMTKNELIDHIHDLYNQNDSYFNEICQIKTCFESLANTPTMEETLLMYGWKKPHG